MVDDCKTEGVFSITYGDCFRCVATCARTTGAASGAGSLPLGDPVCESNIRIVSRKIAGHSLVLGAEVSVTPHFSYSAIIIIGKGGQVGDAVGNLDLPVVRTGYAVIVPYYSFLPGLRAEDAESDIEIACCQCAGGQHAQAHHQRQEHGQAACV